MCPSYMVTRDEIHSTRGRARLLFEMLNGKLITKGWRSKEVLEALDLCLSCKGCLHDCPVNVDMATYKSEFLYHHYRGRMRPLAHISMGLLPYAARIATKAPRVVNFVTHAPGLSRLVKLLAGTTPEREVPAFSDRSFRSWFAEHGPKPKGRQKVLLFPDTFDNFLHAEVGQATVEVLDAAGFDVEIPERTLCCGLTMITNGLLPTAKRALRKTLDAIGPRIEDGTRVIVPEPSCLAVFRHDLLELFPGDRDAERLCKQSVSLEEFLTDFAPTFEIPTLRLKAVVHGHCHEKAVVGMEAAEKVLKRIGLDYEIPDSGCCGLAGSFGFERGHYDVSMACGERVLLPEVRAADERTLIVSDGFSCRTQIDHGTNRRALHIAQVISLALHKERLPGFRPEDAEQPSMNGHHRGRVAAAVGVAAVSGIVARGVAKRRKR
jgi:Fe-S oxidoreductase